MIRYVAMLLLFWYMAENSLAAALPKFSDLKSCGQGVATEIFDGAHFKLQSGQTIRLALVKAPELWAPNDPYKSWPHAAASRNALATLIEGKRLSLFCEGRRTNRLGERIVHIQLPEDIWLQYELVLQGHLFVYAKAGRSHGLEALYQAEGLAREKTLGLWAFNNLRPITASSDKIRTGWFQLIQGTVLKVDQKGKTVFLNFGRDWRKDFTVEIPTNKLKYFTEVGFDPLALKGKAIEARGWVDYKAGPRIVVQSPGQLQAYTP